MKTFSVSRPALLSLLACAVLLGCGGADPDKNMASARSYMDKNDPKAAVIELKNVLQQKPDMAEARFLLGKALLDSGDAPSASVELRKALDLKHPPEDVVPLLARAMLLEGQGIKLIDQFAALQLEDGASQAALKTSLANAYNIQRDEQKAQAALKAALDADPGHVPAQILKVRMTASRRDIDEATKLVDDIIAAHPEEPDAWQLKGDLLAAKADPQGALQAYGKVLGIKPDNVAALGAVVAVHLAKNDVQAAQAALDAFRKVQPKHPQAQYFAAQLAFQKQDYKTTKELLPALLKVAPDNVRVLQLAGATELYSGGSLVQAETHLAKALQISPEMPLAKRLLIQVYLRSGQFAKALTTLEPLLASDAKDPQVLAFAGEAHLQSGDAAKAEKYFTQATQLNPADVRSRTVLAMSHLSKGSADVAYGELQAIAESDKGIAANMALISALLRGNQLDRALKAIDELEAKQPDKPLAANLRGRVLRSRQDVAGARRSFEKALSIDPTFFPAVAGLAELDMADRKPDDAKKRFEALLEKNPKNMQALMALASFKARTGASKEEISAAVQKAIDLNPSELTPRLLLIDHHLASKEFKLASAAAQDANAKLPDNVDILDALGRTQLALSDFNQASTSFNRLVALRPQSPLPHMRLAEVHLANKNPEAAAQSFKRALALKPDLLDAQSGLIKLELGAGRFKEALAVAKTIQTQRSKEAVGFVVEGDIEARRKAWEPALNAYREALKVAPSSELATKMHSVLKASGKQAEAEKFAATWTKDRPNDVAFEFYLGDAAVVVRDYPAAESKYKRVLQLQPDNAPALNNLAWVSTKLKREGALAYAEKANTLRPNQPAFMDTLAMVLADSNQVAKAIDIQKKALALRPDDPLMRLNLAKYQMQAGDKSSAKVELDTLQKLGPGFPAQDEVSALLSKI